MVKYLPDTVSVVFEEIPDKVTLMLEISQCQNNCVGCHSPWLRNDIGEPLTPTALGELLVKNDGVNCVLFSGEGADHDYLAYMASIAHKYGDGKLEVGVYSGREDLGDDAKKYEKVFDYIKVGPYMEQYGPLNKETTNQRLYHIVRDDSETKWIDITNKFWER